MGYTPIAPSAALVWNLWAGDVGGVGIQFGIDGNTPDGPNWTLPYGSTAPVNIDSSDPINVQLYYGQNLLTVWMTDATAGTTFTTSYNVPDLSAIVGGNSALVGFTGATGGFASIQTISDFVFSPTAPPVLSITSQAAGSVAVSWPVAVSTLFGLQESSAVNGPWSNVTNTPVMVNSQNQVTLTPGTSTAFYRLTLQ